MLSPIPERSNSRLGLQAASSHQTRGSLEASCKEWINRAAARGGGGHGEVTQRSRDAAHYDSFC